MKQCHNFRRFPHQIFIYAVLKTANKFLLNALRVARWPMRRVLWGPYDTARPYGSRALIMTCFLDLSDSQVWFRFQQESLQSHNVTYVSVLLVELCVDYFVVVPWCFICRKNRKKIKCLDFAVVYLSPKIFHFFVHSFTTILIVWGLLSVEESPPGGC